MVPPLTERNSPSLVPKGALEDFLLGDLSFCAVLGLVGDEVLLGALAEDVLGEAPFTDFVGEDGVPLWGALFAPVMGILSGGLLETPGAPTMAM